MMLPARAELTSVSIRSFHAAFCCRDQENHPIVEAEIAGVPVTYAAFCNAVALSDAPLSQAEGFALAHLLGSRAGPAAAAAGSAGSVDVKLLKNITSGEFLHATYN